GTARRAGQCAADGGHTAVGGGVSTGAGARPGARQRPGGAGGGVRAGRGHGPTAALTGGGGPGTLALCGAAVRGRSAAAGSGTGWSQPGASRCPAGRAWRGQITP